MDAFEEHAASAIDTSEVGDRVALHRTRSDNVTFLSADRWGLLLAEIFDCALIGEGILPSLRRARNSLLTDVYESIPRPRRSSERWWWPRRSGP